MNGAYWLMPPKLGLTGKLDLVEKELATGKLMPVEYKRGQPKKSDIDAIQLCAQVLCLEEMTGQSIVQAALWYGKTRQRQLVLIDQTLRNRTLDVIAEVAEIFRQGNTPKAIFGKHCQACSLIDLCNPQLCQKDPSADYVKTLFDMDAK